MQLLNAAPATKAGLASLYAATPLDGMVHSGLMHRERFDIASDFNEDWSCASISWAAGGEEEYRLQGAKPLMVRSAGALTLARGARYAYASRGERRFRSNMISFPHWITDAAGKPALDDEMPPGRRLDTRLFRPEAATQSLMDAIALRCRRAEGDHDWYAEQSALLYARLLDAQDARAAAVERIDAVKPATRAELARRAGVAREIMLQRFDEPGLTLGDIAREACLSPFHLIRVFKSVTGATPMQNLAMIRMEAGMRLLQATTLDMRAIAKAVGYSDRTAFFKAFRKHFGLAPSSVERPAGQGSGQVKTGDQKTQARR